MSTKIDHSTVAAAGGVGLPPIAMRSGSSSTDSPAVQTSTSQDTVHLTGDAMQLQDLDKSMSRTPSVDVKKVAELRHSIASGQYKINDRSVAAKLLNTDRLLGKN